MELEVLSEDERSMLFKVVGEDHTFCNALRKVLHEDESVVAASYTIEHPLLEHPKFYVKVKAGKSPRRVLIHAAERLGKRCGELGKQLQKALKKK